MHIDDGYAGVVILSNEGFRVEVRIDSYRAEARICDQNRSPNKWTQVTVTRKGGSIQVRHGKTAITQFIKE